MKRPDEAASTMTLATTDATMRARVAAEIRARHRFVVSSHVRPDGDAIGSAMAMAFALRAMGKQARVVNRDPAPPPMLVLPGVRDIEIRTQVEDAGDAVIVMECGDLSRTGVEGLGGGYVINIDHHLDNTMYGSVNWFDPTAAACGEMVFDLIGELGVPISQEIATHVYLAILTDTGSFHHSHISPRTFDICRQCVEAGVDPAALAHTIYDNNNLGRVKLFGLILSRMDLDPTERVATLSVDSQLTAATGGTYEDTEGLINFPLSVKEIQGVIFFKEHGPDEWRISMRSKGNVNVNAIARDFGGSGHKNASGCSATGKLKDLKPVFEQRLLAQIAAAGMVGAAERTP